VKTRQRKPSRQDPRRAAPPPVHEVVKPTAGEAEPPGKEDDAIPDHIRKMLEAAYT
jgi:hypothetical protein